MRRKANWKTMLACLTVTIMCALSLSGCATKESEQVTESTTATDTTKDSDSGKKKVVLWTWAEGQFAEAEKKYFEAHPDADWEFEEVVVANEDYLTKLQQGYASGGDMPDLLMAEMGWRGSAFALDIWENLEGTPYNFDRSILLDNTISSITNKDDQVIGIENAVNPAFMMFKQDLALKYFGTDDPKELEKMFQTYEDYATWGQKVYEQSGGKVHLFAGLQDVSNMMFAQQRNINNVDADGNVNVSSKVKPILDTLDSLRSTNTCSNLTQYSSEWNNSFADGSVIFFPGAAWSVTYWVEAYDPEGTDNWGMFTPAGGGFGWGGTCYGVYKSSDMKDEAWDFIQWVLTTKEGGQAMKEGSGFFLPVKSLYDDPTYTEGTRPNFGEQQINKFMMEDIAPNIPDASLSIYDPLVSDSLSMIAEMMQADSSLDATKAMEEYTSDLQAKVPDVTVK